MHSYFLSLCEIKYRIILNRDTISTYVIDSFAIVKAKKDSALYKQLYSFEKDIDIMSFSNNSLDKEQSLQNRCSKDINTHLGHAGNFKLFTLEQDDGVFALLLLCFLCITRIYKGGVSFFSENMRLLFSSRENINLFSQTTIREFWFNFILIFQSILLTSVILFDYFLVSNSNKIPVHSFYTITMFIVVISSFLAIKYCFYRFTGWVFGVQKKLDVWLRTYMIVIEMLGIIAFIPTLILVYSVNFQLSFIHFLIILFVISRIILFYRVSVFFLQSNVNILYLITYLCNVEIIPYILLFYFLEYLYKIDLTSLLWL